ncbi:putative bifunctional diguanylate cyclase/phosphodiesterase [Shewanella sp. YIC-542]|uniref:putative bifunctional diguanylate cyclase/phosphodiesterase n=1 Tax=Shewanella mytili TaxID=3377111 RepID=UPI00398E4443
MYIDNRIRLFIGVFCLPALLAVTYCLNLWFEHDITQHQQQMLQQDVQRIQQRISADMLHLQQLLMLYTPVLTQPAAAAIDATDSDTDISLFVAPKSLATLHPLVAGPFPAATQLLAKLQGQRWLGAPGSGILFIEEQPVMLSYRYLPDGRLLLASQWLSQDYLSSLDASHLAALRWLRPFDALTPAVNYQQLSLPALGNEPVILEIRMAPQAAPLMQWHNLPVIGILLVGGICLLALGYVWLRFKLMRPFAQLMDELAQIDPGTRNPAILSGRGGGEFTILADRINALVLRICRHKEHSRITLESIAEAVLLTDRHARVIYLNPQAERLLGINRRQAMTTTLSELFQSANSLDAEIKQFMSAGSRQPEHYKMTLSLSRPRILDRALSNLRDASGNIVGSVIVLRDITDEERLKHQLQRRADYDAITALLNRRAFEDQLPDFVAHARTLAVCYLDLEQFKLINDNCGHAAGDRMLALVARAIETQLRTQDLLARLGGDEFGLVIRDCSSLEVIRQLKEIVHQVNLQTIQHQGVHYRVGVSIGVAFSQEEPRKADELLKDADIACIAAKRKGSSQIHIFDGRNRELAYERNAPQWALRITRAIEARQLLLYFQPIRNLNGRCERQRLEILLRIQDENGRVLPPGQFIAAAERFKLMQDVDKEVIRMAFEWLAAHRTLCHEIVMSINLSANSLGADGMLEYITAQQARYGIPSSCVCFEITETSAIQNRQQAMSMLKAMRQQGLSLALDDFGSGFASYGYLRELPVDYVKIDGCFVRQLAGNPRDYAIVKSIHDVCRTMGIETVAEFIESQDIIDKLNEIGIHYAQGYAIGRPMPLAQYRLPSSGLRVVAEDGPALAGAKAAMGNAG